MLGTKSAGRGWLAKAACAVLASQLAWALYGANTANATFSGSNGPITFSGTYTRPFVDREGRKLWSDAHTLNSQIYTVSPKQVNRLSKLTNLFEDGSEKRPWDSLDNPKWSPDGKQIAFQAPEKVGKGTTRRDIMVINADGSGLHRLKDRDYGEVDGPTWSPDGSKVAFDAWDGEAIHIFIANADGSGTVRDITEEFDIDIPDFYELDWSPDGSKILLQGARQPGIDPELEDHFYTLKHDIYTVDVDNGTVNRLTPRSWDNSEDPSWSPDGKKILFESTGPNTKTPGTIYKTKTYKHSTGIYVMDADGSNKRLILGSVSNPVWSPDGKKIVYVDCPSSGFSEQIGNFKRFWKTPSDDISSKGLLSNYQCQLRTMGATGKNQQDLAVPPKPDTGDKSGKGKLTPSWDYTQPDWQAVKVADTEPPEIPGNPQVFDVDTHEVTTAPIADNRVDVPVSCQTRDQRACNLTVVIRNDKGEIIGRETVTTQPTANGTVRVPLTNAALQTVGTQGTLSTRVTISGNDQNGHVSTDKTTLTLTR